MMSVFTVNNDDTRAISVEVVLMSMMRTLSILTV